MHRDTVPQDEDAERHVVERLVPHFRLGVQRRTASWEDWLEDEETRVFAISGGSSEKPSSSVKKQVNC